MPRRCRWISETRGVQRLCGAGLLVLLTAGCATLEGYRDDVEGLPREARILRGGPLTPEPAREETTPGSLWRSATPVARLFQDTKARNVGDILTITIVESASARKNATTETSRETSNTAGISSLLGFERLLRRQSGLVGATGNSSFEGEGTTTRSESLTATVSARVTRVLDNGNLMIEGRREIRVNNENQVIVLTGIVRPEDIQRNNTVLSNFIADARIVYTGSGVVSDRQRPGWLARILDFVWPF